MVCFSQRDKLTYQTALAKPLSCALQVDIHQVQPGLIQKTQTLLEWLWYQKILGTAPLKLMVYHYVSIKIAILGYDLLTRAEIAAHVPWSSWD